MEDSRRVPPKSKKAKKGDSEDEESLGIHMLKSVNENQFVIKSRDHSSQSQGGGYKDNHSSRSFDSSDQKSTKKEMIRFLSRILDRNKPLFVFNTRLNADEHS